MTNPTSNLVVQLRAWLASDKARKYACARYYRNDFDPVCEGCLIRAAVNALENSPVETTGYVLHSACVKALLEAADRAGVEHVTFGVMDPKSGFHPDLPGYIGVIREDVAKLKASLQPEKL